MGGIRSMKKWVYYFIIFFVYLIFGDISIWWFNFFGSQAKKFDLSLSLSLILRSSLAWLINQAKPSQAQAFWHSHKFEFKLFFRLISSSSQIWAFVFYWRVKLKHTLLDKAWLVYNPMWTNLQVIYFLR